MSKWSELAFERFWEAMCEIYGGPDWIKKHGEVPDKYWRKMLEGMDYDRVKATIDLCDEYCDQYVISMSQFRGRYHDVRMPQPDQKYLPPKNPVPKEKVTELAKGFSAEGGRRRNCFKPGETLPEFMDALCEALGEGKTRQEFEMDRMKQNGWTDEDEQQYQQMAHSLGVRL